MTTSRRGVPSGRMAWRGHFARLLTMFAVLVAALLTIAPAAAQQSARTEVRATGQVLDGITRQPVRGAYVEVTGTGRKAFTDDHGRFVLANVPAGTREIRVEQLGYETAKLSRMIDGSASIEVVLTPDPVVLAQIDVINDRLTRRRRSVTTSVMAYDVERLRESPAFDAHEFVRQRVFDTPCPVFGFDDLCIYRRGRVIAPRVYIDEVWQPAGAAFLRGLNTQDLYLVEIYGGGSQIRVYTNWFTRNLAYGRAHLDPIVLF